MLWKLLRDNVQSWCQCVRPAQFGAKFRRTLNWIFTPSVIFLSGFDITDGFKSIDLPWG